MKVRKVLFSCIVVTLVLFIGDLMVTFSNENGKSMSSSKNSILNTKFHRYRAPFRRYFSRGSVTNGTSENAVDNSLLAEYRHSIQSLLRAAGLQDSKTIVNGGKFLHSENKLVSW